MPHSHACLHMLVAHLLCARSVMRTHRVSQEALTWIDQKMSPDLSSQLVLVGRGTPMVTGIVILIVVALSLQANAKKDE